MRGLAAACSSANGARRRNPHWVRQKPGALGKASSGGEKCRARDGTGPGRFLPSKEKARSWQEAGIDIPGLGKKPKGPQSLDLRGRSPQGRCRARVRLRREVEAPAPGGD